MAPSVEERAEVYEGHRVLGPLSSLILPVEAESAHLAREWLGLVFDVWMMPQIEDAQLCVSELVSNVFNHARKSRTMRVVISRFPNRLRVDVYDSSTAKPKIDKSLNLSESGNGLFLVEALSSDWGSHLTRTTEGKCVWFAMDLTDLAADASAG